MIFLETPLFSKRLKDYMDDREYSDFQSYLMQDPTAGDLIPGTGGLRKIRWGAKNKGKRGGMRIIYYWQTAKAHIYLLTLYAKNETQDLSADDKKALKQLVERWLS